VINYDLVIPVNEQSCQSVNHLITVQDKYAIIKRNCITPDKIDNHRFHGSRHRLPNNQYAVVKVQITTPPLAMRAFGAGFGRRHYGAEQILIKCRTQHIHALGE
jgi:hypothetical protein